MTATNGPYYFEVIPLAQVPRSDADEASSEESPGRRPVVLVVDDEQIITDTRVAIFTGWGFNAIAAYDSVEALSKARSIPPDLVISDVTLSGMNGVELAIEIQRDAPDCKVLLISGQTVSADLLAQAQCAGHNFTMLTKPVHPTEMVARLDELDFRLQNQVPL